MKKYILALLLSVLPAFSAVTDAWILQRDTATTFQNVVITGSSNLNKVIGFDDSGIIAPLSTATLNINGTVGATTPGTGAFTTLSASNAASFADGTAAAPSIAFSTQPTVGFRLASAGGLYWNTTSTDRGYLNGGGVNLQSAGMFAWAPGTAPGSLGDTYIARNAAAAVRIGNIPSATPIAQSLILGESSRSGTDTNVAGASGTIASGTGTGTGAVSSLIFQTPTVGSSGTAAQALATRLTISSAGIVGGVGVPIESQTGMQVAATGNYRFAGRSKILSSAASKFQLANDGASTGVTLDASTDGTLTVRNFADSADGALTASSLTASTLTATRVPFATTGGLLIDESAFAYNSGTNTLSVDNITAGAGTFSGTITGSAASAASAPADTLTGAWFTGGTATTTKPHFLIEPAGTTSNAWNTLGTGLGINAASGFSGNLINAMVNGGSSLFSVNYLGGVSIANSAGTELFFTGAGSTANITSQAGMIINAAANSAVTTAAVTHTGAVNAFSIQPTYNQTGGVGATDLLIYRTETAVGSGAQNLIDAQVGAVSKFKVTNVGHVVAEAPIKPKGYTVATLPATAAAGMVTGAHAYVTDATAPTYLGTLTGGGAVTCPVFYNGSAWVSH